MPESTRKKARGFLHLRDAESILAVVAGILFCMIVLLHLPEPATGETTSQYRMSETEYQEQMHNASVKMSNAETYPERQAAAREMASIKSRYTNPSPAFKGYDGIGLLRWASIITILILSGRLIFLGYKEIKYGLAA